MAIGLHTRSGGRGCKPPRAGGTCMHGAMGSRVVLAAFRKSLYMMAARTVTRTEQLGHGTDTWRDWLSLMARGGNEAFMMSSLPITKVGKSP